MSSEWFFYLLNHHAVLLEDLFQLLNNFDGPIKWRVRVSYFILGETPRIFETAKYKPAKGEG
jgi:hypothetical protein